MAAKRTALVLMVSIAFLCVAPDASADARVSVSVRTEKTAFLASEPVIVAVEVRNVGTERLTHSLGSGRIRLSVPGGAEKPARRLTGCCAGEGVSDAVGTSTHPPLLQPGETATFRYLLRGYRLRPGRYELHASGKADVGWPGAEWGTPPAAQKPFDPIDGQTFDRTLSLTVLSGTPRQLEAAYAPYLEAAFAWEERTHLAQQALFESAPPLLERRIAVLAEDSRLGEYVVTGAVRALGEINSRSSRARLRALFDAHDGGNVRSAIVQSLAQTYHPDNLAFFAGVLNGNRDATDRTRRYAALGLGRIGGVAAVRALASAPVETSASVAGAVLEALGNTKERTAIPILIARARGSNGYVLNEVCCALSQLTHHAWCDGSGNVSATQARWRRWWAANAATTRLYGPDECPLEIARLPELRVER